MFVMFLFVFVCVGSPCGTVIGCLSIVSGGFALEYP